MEIQKNKKAIFVAMSGGVDSSVVAGLMKEQGHNEGFAVLSAPMYNRRGFFKRATNHRSYAHEKRARVGL